MPAGTKSVASTFLFENSCCFPQNKGHSNLCRKSWKIYCAPPLNSPNNLTMTLLIWTGNIKKMDDCHKVNHDYFIFFAWKFIASRHLCDNAFSKCLSPIFYGDNFFPPSIFYIEYTRDFSANGGLTWRIDSFVNNHSLIFIAQNIERRSWDTDNGETIAMTMAKHMHFT